MSDASREDNKHWRYTKITVATLTLIGNAIWFCTTLTYEPLIAFFPIVLAIIVAHYNTRWQIDSIVAISLIALFVGGIFLVQRPNSTEQLQSLEFNYSEAWLFLVVSISLILLVAIGLIVAFKRDNLISRTFLWALIGNTDVETASIFLEHIFKMFVSSILWGIITSLASIVILLLLTIIMLALGSSVSGTKEAIVQFGVLGAVLGSLLGIIMAVIRIIFPNTKNKVIILSAKYGANNGWMDVAPLLKTKIKNGKLQISANNSELGDDPAPGVVKQLNVIYSYNGITYTKIVSETEMLTLPEP